MILVSKEATPEKFWFSLINILNSLNTILIIKGGMALIRHFPFK